MSLQERLAQHARSFDTVRSVATYRDSLMFTDLCWPPFDCEEELRRFDAHRDPGVMFESSYRVFVVEEHSGQLRFYAGGWRDQVYDQPNELGKFASAEDAIRYAEAFLVHGLHPRQMGVSRFTRGVGD